MFFFERDEASAVVTIMIISRIYGLKEKEEKYYFVKNKKQEFTFSAFHLSSAATTVSSMNNKDQ